LSAARHKKTASPESEKAVQKQSKEGRIYFFFVSQVEHSFLESQVAHSFFVSQEEHSFLGLQQLAQEARDRVRAARARVM
jgi:hypothetical protein